MAWIQSHQELGRHWKTDRVATILNIHPMQVVGHLHGIWWWALDFAQDGDLSRFYNQEIANACRWDGDADAFIAALVEAGFLRQEGDNLFIHDWENYSGRTLRERAQGRERMQRFRESKKAQNSPSAHVERNVTRNHRVTCGTREEESRELRSNSHSEGVLVTTTGLPANPPAHSAPDGATGYDAQFQSTDKDLRAVLEVCKTDYYGDTTDRAEVQAALLYLRNREVLPGTEENIRLFAQKWPTHPLNTKKSRKPFPGQLRRFWADVLEEAPMPREIVVPDEVPKHYRHLVIQLGEQSPENYAKLMEFWASVGEVEKSHAVQRLRTGDIPLDLVRDYDEHGTFERRYSGWTNRFAETGAYESVH